MRGADTDRHDLAPQSAGLEAIFAGLRYNMVNDEDLLTFGIQINDGLYNWAKYLYTQKHTEGPAEQMLLEIFKSTLTVQAVKSPLNGQRN